MSGGANTRPASENTPGLCLLCRHVRRIRSDRGSVFYQCLRSFTDAAFAAYPRLPVLQCRGFEPTSDPSHGPAASGPSAR